MIIEFELETLHEIGGHRQSEQLGITMTLLVEWDYSERELVSVKLAMPGAELVPLPFAAGVALLGGGLDRCDRAILPKHMTEFLDWKADEAQAELAQERQAANG
jgi:hypothetical protein